MSYTYVFGPVASSRLGLSLGLDLLGKRVCSMDCLYCEVGATDELTLERKPYVPAEVILGELADWRAENSDTPDFVTLGGSGEPCLNSDMGRIITGCREILPQVPVAVLTNSTLLSSPDVCDELMLADVVLPSMDSLVQKEFQKLNRPCGGLDAATVAEALLAFGGRFSGRIFLEILLAQGINDSEENLTLLKEFVGKLDPDRVDVTSLSRPGAFSNAKPVSKDVRKQWCDALAACTTSATDEPQTIFLRTGQRADLVERDLKAASDMVMRSLQRRPQTPGQLAMALSLPLDKIEYTLSLLEQQGRITRMEQDQSLLEGSDEPFYSCR